MGKGGSQFCFRHDEWLTKIEIELFACGDADVGSIAFDELKDTLGIPVGDSSGSLRGGRFYAGHNLTLPKGISLSLGESLGDSRKETGAE